MLLWVVAQFEIVIPTKVGIQDEDPLWIPVFTGITGTEQLPTKGFIRNTTHITILSVFLKIF